MARSLTLGVLFLTALGEEVVAKPVTLSVLPSISVILASQSVFLTSLVVSDISISGSLILFSATDL